MRLWGLYYFLGSLLYIASCILGCMVSTIALGSGTWICFLVQISWHNYIHYGLYNYYGFSVLSSSNLPPHIYGTSPTLLESLRYQHIWVIFISGILYMYCISKFLLATKMSLCHMYIVQSVCCCMFMAQQAQYMNGLSSIQYMF